MPIVQKVMDARRDGDVALVNVSVDKTEAELVKRYAQKRKITLPILIDPTQETRKKYSVRVTPTLFVMDKDLKVKGIYAGMFGSRSQYQSWLDRLFTAVATNAPLPTPPQGQRRSG